MVLGIENVGMLKVEREKSRSVEEKLGHHQPFVHLSLCPNQQV
jgi:hypothetical protein